MFSYWQTPCTFLGTTTSLNGHHFCGTTPHPHLACWGPLLLTALELQVGGLWDLGIWGGGELQAGFAHWLLILTAQELALGCPSTGMGLGSQK